MAERNREQLPERSARGQSETNRQAAHEPREEVIEEGQLYFLWHPTTTGTFSGYGLTLRPERKDLLAGLLMVDRPQPVNHDWLKQVESTFGEYQLAAMTVTGERGITCQMRIEPESLPYVRQLPTEKAPAIKQALTPLLERLPKPYFRLRWDEEQRLWASEIVPSLELPPELREVFARTGPGCVPTETNLGVVHVCHAADQDIAGFANKPAMYQWQLALMPTAPVLRLEISILDQPDNPYKFESFLNVGRRDDARVLIKLISQAELYLAFHGDDFTHRFTKVIEHRSAHQEQLRQLANHAMFYCRQLPEAQRDFDRAKAEFQRYFPL